MSHKFMLTDSTDALVPSEDYRDAVAALDSNDLATLRVYFTALKDMGVQCSIKTQAAIKGGSAAATAAERAIHYVIRLFETKEGPAFGKLWPAFCLVTRYLEESEIIPKDLIPEAHIKQKLKVCFLLHMSELTAENAVD